MALAESVSAQDSEPETTVANVRFGKPLIPPIRNARSDSPQSGPPPPYQASVAPRNGPLKSSESNPWPGLKW
jgi:hypothetical protein